jgi:hypothetical protein
MFATAVGVRGFNTLPDVLMFGAAGPLEHLTSSRQQAMEMQRVLAALALLATSLAVAQSAYPITINHELGETVIEWEPTRLVTISEKVSEPVTVLGVKPVGHAARRPVGTELGGTIGRLDAPLKDALEGALFVGLVTEPSLEAIASLEPDLIIAYIGEGSFVTGGYEPLSRIAPTLAFSFEPEEGSFGWIEPLRQTAPKSSAPLCAFSPPCARRRRGYSPVYKTPSKFPTPKEPYEHPCCPPARPLPADARDARRRPRDHRHRQLPSGPPRPR